MQGADTKAEGPKPPPGARKTQEGIAGKVGELRYRIACSEAGRGWNLILRLDRKFDLGIKIERESGGGLFRKIGYTKKIETGDPEFDGLVNLIAPDPEVARAFVANGRRKEALGKLFSDWPELDYVVYGLGECSAGLSGAELDGEGARLAALVEGLAAAAEPAADLPPEKARWLPFYLLCLNALLFVGGLCALLFQPRGVVSAGSTLPVAMRWFGLAMLV